MVAPTPSLEAASETATLATGALTTMLAEPTTPASVAEIVVVPGATAVIVPVDETVATAVFEDVHVTVPDSALPDASIGCAVACA